MSIFKNVLYAIGVAALLGSCSPKGTSSKEHLSNDTITIVTWNVNSMFSPADALERLDDLQQLYAELSPDILLVQEITSLSTLDTIMVLLGLEGYQAAISDFSAYNKDKPYFSLEVGVISRYPLSAFAEFDPRPDSSENETPLTALTEYGIEDQLGYRGVHQFKIAGTDFYLNNVHLKSSRGKVGEADYKNAKKRETVMAFLAKNIAEKSKANENATFLVAGDFNVGHSDTKKNGTSIEIDCLDYKACEGKDLYDETHALLTGGLIDGLTMENILIHVKDPSYPSYPGTPIDNIVVYGKYQNGFNPASLAKQTYGSDHLPIKTTMVIPVDTLRVKPAVKVKVDVPEQKTPMVKIVSALPNPAGDENIKEKVTVKNTTAEVIDLTGWVLKDKANTTWSLNSLGTLAPGQEKTILRNGQKMALNNSNETVKLINANGELVDKVFYVTAREDETLRFE